MIRNMPPSPGETLEAVSLIFRALDVTKMNRMYEHKKLGQVNQVRRMAAGALYYVGAANFDLTASLLNFANVQRVAHTIDLYQDMPRAIRDPWESTVRNLAYFWRNEVSRIRHNQAGRVAWASLPEIVKYVADNRWQQKIIITGPMIVRLRMIAGMDGYQPPGWDCPMCRKLERRRLARRSVLVTSERKRAVMSYRITQVGRRVLGRADGSEPQRSPKDDPGRNRSDAVARH